MQSLTPNLSSDTTPRESGKSLSGPFRDSFPDSPDFLQTFPDSRGVPEPDVPGDIFSDFFGVSGLEGTRDPVNGQRVPNIRFFLAKIAQELFTQTRVSHKNRQPCSRPLNVPQQVVQRKGPEQDRLLGVFIASSVFRVFLCVTTE